LSPNAAPGTDLSRLRKILLIRFRRIGDIVLTTPAVRILRRALPAAELVYVVEEPYRKLVEGHPDLDGTIAVRPGQNRRDFLKLVREIRKKRFDAVLDFHGGPRASYLTWLSGARLRVGYEIRWRGFLYDIRIPRRTAAGPVHSVENHVNLVRALGVEAGEIPGLVLPPAGGPVRHPEDLSGHPIPLRPGTRTIALHIGAGNRFRDWGAENVAELAVLLGRIEGVRVVLVGGHEDLPNEFSILSRAPGTTSLIGRIDLGGLKDFIGRAAVFVGSDSGPMHIAAAVGTPIVALFGPTLPAHFGPWKAGEKARILEKPYECRPCRQHECLHGDYRCLRTITPREVYLETQAFLG
jgi:lipopolysaccharide heptosyltransferase II